mgnify:FL=1
MIYPGNINFLKDPIVNRNSFDVVHMTICSEHYCQWYLVVDIANQRLRFSQRQC